MFARRDELLREQRTHPGRSLDRPQARFEPCRPGEQPSSLIAVSVDTDRVDHLPVAVDRGSGV